MIRFLTLAATLALTSCATTPAGYPKPRGSVERVEAAYLQVRGPAEAVIGRLPEPVRGRAGAALILADAALAVARSDATPLARAAAVRQLIRAVAILAEVNSPALAGAADPGVR